MSCFAARRESWVIDAPDIIRAISSIRSSVFILIADIEISLSKTFFRMDIWSRETAAIWGEWVIEMTCIFSDVERFLMAIPIAWAARPPIPMSISSKIIVRHFWDRARTVFIAKFKRAASPPDAISVMGDNWFFLLKFARNSMRSIPIFEICFSFFSRS